MTNQEKKKPFDWPKTAAPPTAGQKTQRGVIAVAFLFVVGIVVVSIVLSRTIPDDVKESGATVGLTAFVLFFAAGAIGASLGFLFGLPRSRYVDQTSAPPPGTNPAPTTTVPSAANYLTNSNLIRVSDWLTTIVVGLGLVNLTKIRPSLNELENTLAEPLGGSPSAGIIGVSIVLVAILAGALLTFLWTSIKVRELLEDSERQYEKNVPPLESLTVRQARDLMAFLAIRLILPPDASDERIIDDQSLPPGRSALVGSEMIVTLKPTTAATGTEHGPDAGNPGGTAPPPNPDKSDTPGGDGDGQRVSGVGTDKH